MSTERTWRVTKEPLKKHPVWEYALEGETIGDCRWFVTPSFEVHGGWCFLGVPYHTLEQAQAQVELAWDAAVDLLESRRETVRRTVIEALTLVELRALIALRENSERDKYLQAATKAVATYMNKGYSGTVLFEALADLDGGFYFFKPDHDQLETCR